MNYVKFLVVIFLFTSHLVHASFLELSNWRADGPISNGLWNVSEDGLSVEQSIHSNPTFFISEESYLNTTFSGNFGVTNNSDDDFLGFIFGFNGFNDFYLFDWKRVTQDHLGRTATEGFRLAKITNSNTAYLWDHSGNGIDSLASEFGENMGWEDNVNYEVTLHYSSSNINISINGGNFENQQIFNLSGLSNVKGQFGFYNSSQADSYYSNFSVEEDDVAIVVSEPNTMSMILLYLVLLLAFSIRRRFAK